jgi:chromosome segregation protein
LDTEGKVHTIKRTRSSSEAVGLNEIQHLLVDQRIALRNPLRQLSQTLIIRDEFIARLSLDLTEAARFQFLREALGSIDADEEGQRAQSLHQLSKKKLDVATDLVATARTRLTDSMRRIDELRKALADDQSLETAGAALRQITNITAPIEALAGIARPAIAAWRVRLERLERLRALLESAESDRQRFSTIALARDEHQRTAAEREAQIASLQAEVGPPPAILKDTLMQVPTPQLGSMLMELADLGERIGLRAKKCPLCGAVHTPQSYAAGVERTKRRAHRANRDASSRFAERKIAEASVTKARQDVRQAAAEMSVLEQEAALIAVRTRDRAALAAELVVSIDTSPAEVGRMTENERRRIADAERHLSIVETVSFNQLLSVGIEERSSAEREVTQTERRLARARTVEARAKSIHDAARRASGETLDRRLERIGPLLGELYRRLRPHPVWRDIDYKVRGDVRRLLKLEVGDSLNPQFLFSSGQRRATGIAFLLSVFLSTSWRRLNTLILDDPVQHIDDFRAIHLAEVLAQLSATGLQIVCAVEDAALADLLCRRIASQDASRGRRLTLGVNEEGQLSVLANQSVASLPASVLSALGNAASTA